MPFAVSPYYGDVLRVKDSGKTTLFTESEVAKTAIKELLSELETKANPQRAINQINSGGVSAGRQSSLMQQSRARIARNDAQERSNASKKTTKRRIRTQAGAKRYSGNIGDVIGSKKVEKGDTLWDLAKDFYGDPNKWKLIAKANNIDDPKKLPIGTELKFPPDPDDPQGKKKMGARKSPTTSGRRAPAKSGKTSPAKTDKKSPAISDAKDNGDSEVALEATYYAPKDMDIESILKKFYGDTERLDDVLKVNGLTRESDILAGQALILPGIDPKDIYPDKKKRTRAKEIADRKAQGRVPKKSQGGATAKATSRGYTLYNDGSVYGAGGWIVSATKKKAEKRRRAKDRK